MRITLPRTLLCLAMFMTGCQTPVFRDGLFAKKDPPSNKDSAAPSSNQTASNSNDSRPPAWNNQAQNQAGGNSNSAVSQAPPKVPTAAEQRVANEISKGNLALDQKRFTEARIHFETVLSADPKNRHAHHMLGRVGDQQAKYEDAEAHYLKALGESPNDPDLLCDMGYSYFLQGRHDDSKEYLQRALAAQPGHRMSLLNLGALYVDLRDNQQALAYFNQVAPGIQAERLLAAELNRKVARKKEENKAWEGRVSNEVPKSYDELQQKMQLARERSMADREELKRLVDEKRRLEARIAQNAWEAANGGGGAGGDVPLTAPGQGLPPDPRQGGPNRMDGRPIQLAQGRDAVGDYSPLNSFQGQSQGQGQNGNLQAGFQSPSQSWGQNGAPWSQAEPGQSGQWSQQGPSGSSQNPQSFRPAPFDGGNGQGSFGSNPGNGIPGNANPQFGPNNGASGFDPNQFNSRMPTGSNSQLDPSLLLSPNGQGNFLPLGPNGYQPNFGTQGSAPLGSAPQGFGTQGNGTQGFGSQGPGPQGWGPQSSAPWSGDRLSSMAQVPLSEMPAPQGAAQWSPGLINGQNQAQQPASPQMPSGYGQPAGGMNQPQYGADSARRAMTLGMSAGSVFQLPQGQMTSGQMPQGQMPSGQTGPYVPPNSQGIEGGIYNPNAQPGSAASQPDFRAWRQLPSLPSGSGNSANSMRQGQPSYSGQPGAR